DWLLHAIVRHVPAEDAIKEIAPAATSAAQSVPHRPGPHRLRPDLAEAFQFIEGNWLAAQLTYHRKNARTCEHMHERTEPAIKVLNLTVIVVVVFDLCLLRSGASHAYSLILLFFAAVLPALVAGFNGVQFQSESRRLADRSKMAVRMLSGRMKEAADLRAEL